MIPFVIGFLVGAVTAFGIAAMMTASTEGKDGEDSTRK